MRKEFTKMYGYAVGKVVFAVAMVVLAYFVIFRGDADIGTFGKAVCSLCWGVACLIYFVSGISTILNGARQAKTYMENTRYNEARLDEEYENATNYGRIRVGEKHVFANASNGFYVIPVADIETAYTRYYRYTYAYIEAGCLKKRIKMYYIRNKKARDAVQSILWRMEQQAGEQVSVTNP